MSVDLGDTQILVFEIPYGIRIEDGFQFNRRDDEVELDMYSREEVEEIEVMLHERFAFLRFSQNKNRENILYDGQFTVEGDRLGRSISTDVLMHFSSEFMETIPSQVLKETPSDYHETGTIMGSDLSPPLDKHLVIWGVNFLNRFLESYRFFENEYWIKPLTPQTIQDFYLWRNQDGKIDRYRHRTWTRGPSKGGAADTSDLQEFLKSKDRIPLVNRLRLSSRDNIDIGDYQEAIIQSAQLFELWIIQAYLLVSKAEGVSEEQAEDDITKPNGDYFHPYNIFDKFNSDFGYDFKSTNEFEGWEDSTKDVRNEIIHRGYEPSRSEAFEAFEACMEGIYEIQETFKEEISKNSLEKVVDQELPGSNILIEKGNEGP